MPSYLILVKVVHSANSAITSIAASGNTCHVFQDCVSLSMQHSVFAVNPVHKTAFNGETWVLDIGATDHKIHFVTLFTKSLVLYPLLFNCLMARKLLSLT